MARMRRARMAATTITHTGKSANGAKAAGPRGLATPRITETRQIHRGNAPVLRLDKPVARKVQHRPSMAGTKLAWSRML